MDILTTSRLRLRAARVADIAPLHARVFSQPEVMRHAFGGKVLALDEAADFITSHFNFTGAPIGLSPLIEIATDEVIGFAGLNRCRPQGVDDLEIGFVLACDAWGKGYAHEIGAAQLEQGFRQLGCSRLLAQTSPDNAASIRVLIRLGMTHIDDVEDARRGPRRVFCMTVADIDSR